MKVYVAAASSEIERAETWIDMLIQRGITVTCTWPKTIRGVGHANPPDATHAQRKGWAIQDLEEVRESHVLWFLLPDVKRGHKTDGAWAELAFAYSRAIMVVASGEHHSVFVGLANKIFKTDADAFKAICELHKLTS